MLPHLADQLGHDIPVLVTAGIVELLQVMGGLGWIGLELPDGGGSADGDSREREEEGRRARGRDTARGI